MIKLVKENHVAVIRLNRPEKRNALHPDLVKEFMLKVEEIKNDKTLIYINAQFRKYFLHSFSRFRIIRHWNQFEIFVQIQSTGIDEMAVYFVVFPDIAPNRPKTHFKVYKIKNFRSFSRRNRNPCGLCSG